MILQVPGQGTNQKSLAVSLNSKTEAVARSFVDLVQDESEDLKTTDLCMYLEMPTFHARKSAVRVMIYNGVGFKYCLFHP